MLPQSKSNSGNLSLGRFAKTKLCSFFQTGCCRHADARDCKFAHSFEGLVPKPDLSKTVICSNWTFGKCSADDCPFAHGQSTLRKVRGRKKNADRRLSKEVQQASLDFPPRQSHPQTWQQHLAWEEDETQTEQEERHTGEEFCMPLSTMPSSSMHARSSGSLCIPSLPYASVGAYTVSDEGRRACQQYIQIPDTLRDCGRVHRDNLGRNKIPHDWKSE